MGHAFSYLSSATSVVASYKGEEPFNFCIKRYFAANKKFGSRDRKTISNLCYNYFRTFHLWQHEKTEEAIIKSFFLCEKNPGNFLAQLAPELNEKINWSSAKKLEFLGVPIETLFPFLEDLGEPINTYDFSASMLVQPLLYLRARPGKMPVVIEKITQAALPFEQLTPQCLALPSASALQKIVRLNEDVVVQDYNSQQVFDFLQNEAMLPGDNKQVVVWDCCAASGGKSILLHDKLNGKIQLTVSDIRKSILHNLKERLAQAKVPIYKEFIANLQESLPAGSVGPFDLVVCDAPCTGSGTWSRTPEQLAFFKSETIKKYAEKQLAIASNAAKYLNKRGLLFYITCSVFKKENEDVVASLQQNQSLKLLHQQYLMGYHMQADTMFVAVLQK